jgi:hypothetical protein
MARDDKTQDTATAALGLLVELLAARDQANAVREELTPWLRKVVDPLGVWSDLASGVTAAEVRNLAFDVARIQIQALTELTRQGEGFSRQIVQRLKDAKRPAPASAASGAGERLIVCNLTQNAVGEPHRGQLIAPGRITRLPQALVLRPLEGGAEFPVVASFTPSEDVPTGERVAVAVDPDPWIRSGTHYQARLPLAGTDAVVCFKLVGR